MRRGLIIRIIRSLGVAIILFLCLADIILAIDDPDSTPTIFNIKANRNLLEDGDILIYGEDNIPYGDDYPDEAASSTYIIRLMDGEDTIGTIMPTSYFENGYNEGCFSFYFYESDNVTWGEQYDIRISQNPAYFDESQYWNYEMPLSAYTTYEEAEDNQTELTINIISIAQRLEATHPLYTLLEDSPGGTVLSSPAGETYFRQAIYGIQAMAPELFLVQILDTDTASREWTKGQFESYEDRFSENWTGEEVEASAGQFGLTGPAIMAFIFALPVSIGSIIVSFKKFKKGEPGFVIVFVIITMAALMGWFPTAIYATMYQLMAIYLAYVWFYARG